MSSRKLPTVLWAGIAAACAAVALAQTTDEPQSSMPAPPPERAGGVPDELTPTMLVSLQDDGRTVLVEVFDVTPAPADADPEADVVPRGWLTVVPDPDEGSPETPGEVFALRWDPLAGSLTAEVPAPSGPLLLAAVVRAGKGDARRTHFVPERGMERCPPSAPPP
jgi:hypothetical protein